MTKDVRHIRLEFAPEQHQRLRMAAATCGQSMTAFVRKAVTEEVEKTLAKEETSDPQEDEPLEAQLARQVERAFGTVIPD
jgi:uncharacterized protein (DUF1778 family)